MLETYGKSKEVYPFSLGFVVPLRIDDWRNFATDLFLPNFLTNSFKVHEFYTMHDFYQSRAFYLHAFALSSDLATLPVRMVTAPFWAVYKCACPEEKHPILDLIENNGDSEEAIRAGIVTLISDIEECALVVEGKVVEEGMETEEGVQVEESTAKASRVFRSQTVAFKRLPYGLYSPQVIGAKRDSTYKRVADACGERTRHVR